MAPVLEAQCGHRVWMPYSAPSACLPHMSISMLHISIQNCPTSLTLSSIAKTRWQFQRASLSATGTIWWKATSHLSSVISEEEYESGLSSNYHGNARHGRHRALPVGLHRCHHLAAGRQCRGCGSCCHLCRGCGQSAHAHAGRRSPNAHLNSRDGSGGGNQREYYRSPGCHHRLV